MLQVTNEQFFIHNQISFTKVFSVLYQCTPTLILAHMDFDVSDLMFQICNQIGGHFGNKTNPEVLMDFNKSSKCPETTHYTFLANYYSRE